MTAAPGVTGPALDNVGFDRRTILAAMLGAATACGGCSARHGAWSKPASHTIPCADSARTFTVTHAGVEVRCLFAATSGAACKPGGLAVILLHGANADASQWTDIGLTSVIECLAAAEQTSAVVAVAPDIGDHSVAPALVFDSVLPAIIDCFGSAVFGISGISRGAAAALDCAVDEPTRFRSVGLHSPAITLSHSLIPEPWKCWIDIGTDDALADSATQCAATLRDSGIDLVEHRWPGSHNRAYWRTHLADYIGFHVNAGSS